LAHQENEVPDETREAMEEANALAANSDHASYQTAESLFSALDL
jgi:hypothetical protein